ncbi:unnamed protein product, partial [Hapterophycus canaliculatus]
HSQNQRRTAEFTDKLTTKVRRDAPVRPAPIQGFNCSCFAYGHTGSGKTYSMFGCGDNASLPKDDGELAAPPKGKAFGLVPRVCYSLLSRLQDANTGTYWWRGSLRFTILLTACRVKRFQYFSLFSDEGRKNNPDNSLLLFRVSSNNVLR